MQEYERNILEQYNIEVDSTRKTRGAVLCDGGQGLFLLKEVSSSENRIPVLCELYDRLTDQGYTNVDRIILNREGNAVSCLEDGSKYIVKQWFRGRECDIRKAAELLDAGGTLAKLHIVMQKELEQSVMMAEHMKEVYAKHDRELKKVRRFMRKLSPKGELSLLFYSVLMKCINGQKRASAILEHSDYDRLYEENMKNNCMIHGEYNYHNILIQREEYHPGSVAVTNFEKFKRDVQVEDLYYFLRKVMEKHGWKERLGDNILNAYSAIKPLTKEETEYIKLRLIYPEKFWKIASSYYHSNKAWISVKSIEKLQAAIRQTKEKEKFLEQVFSYCL